MTLLNDRDLKALGPKIIEPFDPAHIQPASIDVHLGPDLKIETFGFAPLNPALDPTLQFDEISLGYGDPTYTIDSDSLVLGSTYEKITVPNGYAARFEGKSSLGRLGLITHVTAGFIDPGFSGQITVEMTKIGRRPFTLHAGMKIGQICFYRMTRDAENPYGSEAAGSHYQGQTGPQISRSHERFKTINVWGGAGDGR